MTGRSNTGTIGLGISYVRGRSLVPRPAARTIAFIVAGRYPLASPIVGVTIETVGEEQLGELLPLMRGYSDFYEVDPTDERPAGFATVYWSWSTTRAMRIGVMNDLFVSPEARGSGAAEALIARCRERCAEHGAGELEWTTAKDNFRAQAVYDRVGGQRDERWIDYSLPVT
jgi:GNAT superfamily N-acetyltransferase